MNGVVVMVPQVFHVNQEVNRYQEAYFSLEQPLVAERLKLKIHNSISIFEKSNRSCWNLKVLGCTFREGNTCMGHMLYLRYIKCS